MSRPGRESLDDLPKFAFGPNWDNADSRCGHVWTQETESYEVKFDEFSL